MTDASTTAHPRQRHEAPAWLVVTGKYFAAYLLGIVVCIVFTPVDLKLVGVELSFYYPLLAIPGYLAFYFYLEGGYLPDGGISWAYWAMFAVGLIPFVVAAIAYFSSSQFFSKWRPLWIAFPVGFLGTIGVYYTVAGSV
ncbi:MAG: hypothetical protein AAF351_06960 [Pseudomonadota bacterium]